MKLALIVDKASQESFYIQDSKVYRFSDDSLYVHPHVIDSQCLIGFWSYAKLFGNGFMFNITKTPELPKLNLDVVIAALELPNWKESLSKIKSAYPNAIIVGTIKEPNNTILEFLNNCDFVASQYSNLNLINVIKPKFWLPQPVDTDYLSDRFFNETKKLQIFEYQHHHLPRRGNTHQFCNYISNKYGIPIIQTVTTSNSNTQWKDFINAWNESIFHVNMDPEYQYGQQATQCAVLGTINIGGVNDSHYHLYPTLANNDFNILETEIEKCLNDSAYMLNIITNAYETVHKHYSIPAVSKTLKETIWNTDVI